MADNLLFTCRKCGFQGNLEGHRCGPLPEGVVQLVPAPPAPRLERAKATLSAVEARFDRAAWHKAYQKTCMKAYMKAYRARRKVSPKV